MNHGKGSATSGAAHLSRATPRSGAQRVASHSRATAITHWAAGSRATRRTPDPSLAQALGYWEVSSSRLSHHGPINPDPGPRPDQLSSARADRRMLMTADPDGRHPSSLLPANLSAISASASTDGSVLAVVTVRLAATERGDQLWIVSHGVTRSVPIPLDRWVAAVDTAPDGRTLYYLLDDTVMARRVATGTVSTLCAHCVPDSSLSQGTVLAVSPDAATVAVTELHQNHLFGSRPTSTVTVRDAASGLVLWHETRGPEGLAVGQTFADNDTLVETVDGGSTNQNPAIHLVTGLRSAHVADTASGVLGYAPQRIGGTWWYYRDSAAGVTTVYVNTDLTPAKERTTRRPRRRAHLVQLRPSHQPATTGRPSVDHLHTFPLELNPPRSARRRRRQCLPNMLTAPTRRCRAPSHGARAATRQCQSTGTRQRSDPG